MLTPYESLKLIDLIDGRYSFPGPQGVEVSVKRNQKPSPRRESLSIPRRFTGTPERHVSFRLPDRVPGGIPVVTYTTPIRTSRNPATVVAFDTVVGDKHMATSVEEVQRRIDGAFAKGEQISPATVIQAIIDADVSRSFAVHGAGRLVLLPDGKFVMVSKKGGLQAIPGFSKTPQPKLTREERIVEGYHYLIVQGITQPLVIQNKEGTTLATVAVPSVAL